MYKLFSLLFLSLWFFIAPSTTLAFKADTFVTISNPVVGFEGWQNTKQTPLDMPKFIYEESTPSALPLTWLLRYDAIKSSTISAFFTKLVAKDKNQSLGLFLTITPDLLDSLRLPYPSGFSDQNIYQAFLSSYEDSQRIQIIDQYMSLFFDKFGFYPKSVYASSLDSFSLQYLQEKYSVLTAMSSDEDFGSDNFRQRGGYIGSPYFPDKNNSLIPARSLKNRVNMAMVRWQPRDFSQFYESNPSSKYSFKIDYSQDLGQDHKYFQNLLKLYSQKNLNEFTHFNLGVENDKNPVLYKTEIKKIIEDLVFFKGEYNLRPISLANFGDWFKARYPESSPAYYYQAKDTLDSSPEELRWYQSPWYRLGLKSNQSETSIIDLRIYNRHIREDHLVTANQSSKLFHEIPAVIDTAKIPEQVLSLNFNLSKSILKYNRYTDFWETALVDGNKRIILDPDKITFIGFTPPVVNSPDIKVTRTKDVTTWTFSPETPFKVNISSLWTIIFIILLCLLIKNQKPPLFGLLLSLLAGSVLYRSGTLNSFGMGFWGPNGHDAIFHLSIIEHFRQSLISLVHPQFAETYLSDYHFFFDYLLGVVSKFTNISPSVLYFIIFPVTASILLVSQINLLLTKWEYKKLEKNLAFIFIFLGGSLGFVPRLLSSQNMLSGESAFWANQSVSMFLNPPFILSLIILLVFLNKIKNLPSTIYSLLSLSLLGGLLAQTKVYAFILLLLALIAVKRFKIFFGVLSVGVALSLPFVTFSGSPFVFQPLWFIKGLFASTDRVYWPKLVEAWQTFEVVGPVSKLFLVNLFALIVFIVGNLGLRVIGFSQLFSKPKNQSQQMVWVIILSGLIIPLIFTQKVNPWNTIQFFYYSILFLGIFSGKVLGNYLTCHSGLDPESRSHKSFKWILVSIVLIFSIFTSLGTLKDYFTYKSASRISYTELQALNKLRNEPSGIVLSPVYKGNSISTPIPQYAYVTSSYVSAFSGKQEFLSDTINLEITGIDYKSRYNNIQKFYSTEDKSWAKQFLQENNIKYVLDTPVTRLKLHPADLGLTIIFDSVEVNLYKIN